MVFLIFLFVYIYRKYLLFCIYTMMKVNQVCSWLQDSLLLLVLTKPQKQWLRQVGEFCFFNKHFLYLFLCLFGFQLQHSESLVATHGILFEQHVGSSWKLEMQDLSHRTTREVPGGLLLVNFPHQMKCSYLLLTRRNR